MSKVISKIVLVLLWFLAACIFIPMLIYMPFGPWPNNTTIGIYSANFTYYDSLQKSMDGWNRAQDHVLFKFEENPNKAKIILQEFKNEEEMAIYCSPGKKYSLFTNKKPMIACVDWQGYKPLGKIRLGVRSDAYISTQILSHELGHVIGLGHTDNHCSIMKSSLEYDCITDTPQTQLIKNCSYTSCDYHYQEYEKCGPMPVDFKSLNYIYKTNVPSKHIWCSEQNILLPGVSLPVMVFEEKFSFSPSSAILK